MNKIKPKKSATRRFKVTGSGKITHRVAFARHLRRNKSKSQLRGYAVPKEAVGRIARRVKRLMGLA